MKSSVSRKSIAITPRGGSVPVGEIRKSAPTRTSVVTTTALTIDSKSRWSTKRHSRLYRPKAANTATFPMTTQRIVPSSSSS